MANDAAGAAVLESVRRAVEAIDTVKEGQELKIVLELIMDGFNAQYIVDNLQLHPRVVNKLLLECREFSTEASAILSAYYTTTTIRHICFNGVNLGNANGRRLLSGLNGNTSVTRLDLSRVGLEGQAGGTVLSELLIANPHLTSLFCSNIRLGVDGARSLQPGIRGNQTLFGLGLQSCQLGDEGISLIVDALDENFTLAAIKLYNNSITSNGLPHVKRLLQQTGSSLKVISLNKNPGLFNDEEYTQDFAMALSRSTKVVDLYIKFCQSPDHALTALFQAAVINKKLTTMGVYDRVRLQGQDRDRLLKIIPETNLSSLHVNLDFMDDTVLSSFHKNTSILHLYDYNGLRPKEIKNGPICDILRRNNRLDWAYRFMKDEGKGNSIIPWSNVISRLSRRPIGASAVYTILRKKLPSCWWLPDTQSASDISPVATATAATGSAPSSNIPKRSHTQATLGDDLETNAKSLVSQPQQKRARRPSSPQSMLKENEEDGSVQERQESGSQVDTGILSTHLNDVVKP